MAQLVTTRTALAPPPSSLAARRDVSLLAARLVGEELVDELPAGLTTIDGKTKVEGDAGDLGPGESKKMAFRVKASKTGSYSNKASARSANDLTAESNTTTTVFRQPVLQVACTAPSTSVTLANETMARIREPAASGETKRTRLRP